MTILATLAMLPFAGILPQSAGFYLALMVAGFVVGGYGHLIKARWMIALGIALIFLATLILPLAANVADESPPPPGPNIQGP